jgi:hypothetical protein
VRAARRPALTAESLRKYEAWQEARGGGGRARGKTGGDGGSAPPPFFQFGVVPSGDEDGDEDEV